MNCNYITQEVVYKQDRFLIMHWELFTGKYASLSNEAKVLYTLLLDRAKLSVSNHYLDQNGRAFIFFTREDAAKKLNTTERTARKVFKELVSVDLIEEKKQKAQKANIIFVKLPEKSTVDTDKTKKKKEKKKTMLEKKQQTVKNLNTSIKIKKEVLRSIEQTIAKKKLNQDLLRLSPETIAEVKEQIEYDLFAEDLDAFHMSMDFLDSFVYAVAEMKTADQTKVGNTYYDNYDVNLILQQLDSCTFMDFWNDFRKIANETEYFYDRHSGFPGKYKQRSKLAGIRNLKAYLKSSLLNFLQSCDFLYGALGTT